MATIKDALTLAEALTLSRVHVDLALVSTGSGTAASPYGRDYELEEGVAAIYRGEIGAELAYGQGIGAAPASGIERAAMIGRGLVEPTQPAPWVRGSIKLDGSWSSAGSGVYSQSVTADAQAINASGASSDVTLTCCQLGFAPGSIGSGIGKRAATRDIIPLSSAADGDGLVASGSVAAAITTLSGEGYGCFAVRTLSGSTITGYTIYVRLPGGIDPSTAGVLGLTAVLGHGRSQSEGDNLLDLSGVARLLVAGFVFSELGNGGDNRALSCTLAESAHLHVALSRFVRCATNDTIACITQAASGDVGLTVADTVEIIRPGDEGGAVVSAGVNGGGAVGLTRIEAKILVPELHELDGTDTGGTYFADSSFAAPHIGGKRFEVVGARWINELASSGGATQMNAGTDTLDPEERGVLDINNWPGRVFASVIRRCSFPSLHPNLYGFEASIIRGRGLRWAQNPGAMLFRNCIIDVQGESANAFFRYITAGPSFRDLVLDNVCFVGDAFQNLIRPEQSIAAASPHIWVRNVVMHNASESGTLNLFFNSANIGDFTITDFNGDKAGVGANLWFTGAGAGSQSWRHPEDYTSTSLAAFEAIYGTPNTSLDLELDENLYPVAGGDWFTTIANSPKADGFGIGPSTMADNAVGRIGTVPRVGPWCDPDAEVVSPFDAWDELNGVGISVEGTGVRGRR